MLTVFELRNYEMRPGGRDVLIPMFEAHFLESQEALGSIVLGIFRDLDDPTRFVWIRGFENAAARYAALDGFYTSPIWREHRNAANATMIDSDNVLQLRAIDAPALTHPGPLPPAGQSSAIIVASTYALPPSSDADFAAAYRREALPRLRERSAAPFAMLATEHAPNAYPRLPIRENETVFVTFTRFDSAEAYAHRHAALIAIDRDALRAAPEIMRLSPTPRSRLR